MNTKGKEQNTDRGKSMEVCIAGHQVLLCFSKEADAAIAQRVRNCLLDAYIRRNAGNI